MAAAGWASPPSPLLPPKRNVLNVSRRHPAPLEGVVSVESAAAVPPPRRRCATVTVIAPGTDQKQDRVMGEGRKKKKSAAKSI